MVHKYEVLIREKHLDFIGHVNNAVYLELFEEARWEWITEVGFGFDKIQKHGITPVVLEVTLRFEREIRLRTKITIETSSKKLKGKIGKIDQRMVGDDGQVFCTADIKYGVMDINARKLITPPETWTNLFY